MANYRPYFREVAPTLQQENILALWKQARDISYNFVINLKIHLWHVYVAYLKAHHVKKRSQLNKAEKQATNRLFPSFIKTKQHWSVRDWYRNVYQKLPRNDQVYTYCQDLNWIKDSKMPSHTFYHAMYVALQADANFHFNGAGQPHRKGHYSELSLYFDGTVHISRTLLKLSYLGYLHLSEKGSLPTDNYLQNQGYHVKAIYLSKIADKYYVSVITNQSLPICKLPKYQLHGHLGIDVGIDSEATINALNGFKAHWFGNITKSKKYIRIVYHKHIWQRRMSRRPAQYYQHQAKYDNDKKLKRPISKGYLHAKLQFQKKCKRITDLVHGYLRKIAYQIIQRKPKSITIEHLNIKDMLQNHKLAKAIQQCNWGYFYKWLAWLCRKYGIELRQVSQYYPSTKICHLCGHYDHKQFKGNLSDLGIRTMHCDKYDKDYDRDLNAAINLARAKKYRILVNPNQD